MGKIFGVVVLVVLGILVTEVVILGFALVLLLEGHKADDWIHDRPAHRLFEAHTDPHS